MTLRFVIFVLLSISIPTFAQKQGQELIDSLVTELPKVTNDTLKARLYNRIINEYFLVDAKKALFFGRQALSHTTRMKWNKGIGVFNSVIARGFSSLGNYDSCMYHNQLALAFHRKDGDTRNMASTLNNMGAAEQNLTANYPKAIQYYLQGLKEADKLDDKYMVGVGYDNVAQIYFTQKNYPKALDYAFRSLRIREKLPDTDVSRTSQEVANSFSSIAGIYMEMQEPAKAKAYYQKAITLYNDAGNNEGLAKTYSNFAILLGTDYRKKIEYGLMAEKLWNEINPSDTKAVTNTGNLGSAYLDMYRDDTLSLPGYSKPYLLAEAEKYLKKAVRISDESGDISNRAYYTGILAELQALKGDYKNAYLNFRDYQTVQDSLFSQESKNQIAGLEGEREIALRDKEIQINKLALRTQKNQQIGLIIGLAMLATIGGLLYWQSRMRKRSNIKLLHLNSELDEANQVKARFFAILSHDLRSPVANLVNFLHLQREAPDLMTPEMADAHEKRITGSAEGLLETMESMLLWSKSQMQQFKPQARPVAVSELFNYIERFFSGTSGVSFSFENPSSLVVVTDEDYLKTIMQNLTHNAVKALRQTTDAQIRWEAREENGSIVLAIMDNGPGASEAQLEALYSDQVSIGIKSGLGLHLIRDLAKAISCQISVTPNLDQGMVFRLAFVTIS
ncbi:MAG: tetratricopeptide repeat-containing sensor histidine kinase [Dyadobacter sp.]|uniref:ATP-binding protein n=1 Tax=Dyadobacter sp. TaxID=1914288 RepID=UPI00326428A3